MATAVNAATARAALGLAAEATARAEVLAAAGAFAGLVKPEDAAVLLLCARLGAVDTERQLRLRAEMTERADVLAAIRGVEAVLSAHAADGFLDGAAPGASDAELAAAMYDVFALLFKPADRAKFPAVAQWFANCTAHLQSGGLLGAAHCLAEKRAGGMVDCFANSAYVRVNADRANELNANFKKKKTQRQLEKEAKAGPAGAATEKVEAPPAAETFLFGAPVAAEASNDDKIAAVKAALVQVGGDADPMVVTHPAAKGMADMPPELKEKGGFVCKNLFLKAKKPRKGVENDSCLWLISVPEEAKVNLKEVSKSLGYKDELRQAKPDVMLETLGLKPGGVTPFGVINDSEVKVNVLLDQEMMSSPDNKLWFHPLTNEATMQVSADSLFKLIAASRRVPTLMEFAREDAAAADNKAADAAGAADAKPAAPALNLSHDEAQQRIWDRLKAAGVEPYREENPDLDVTRPTGHSTHNLFVKDKKTKKMFLVTVRQDTDVNMNDLAKKLGVKMLRMASGAKEEFCHERGCITTLHLLNNTQGTITPVIDSRLFAADSLRMCTGCENPLDHSQHNVIDIKPETLRAILAETNGPAIIELDFAEQ